MKVSLFLHSTGTGPFLWAHVPDEVTKGTTKIAPTNLGYPPNDPLPRGTPCTAKDDARKALESVPGGASEIDLYAHSYGGVIALELLPMLGGRVRSMFLYEPVVFAALANGGAASDPEATAEARSFLADEWFLTDDEKGGTEPWLARFIDYWNRPGSWERMPDHLKAYPRAAGWKMYQEVRSCFFDIASFDDVRFGDVRTTLLYGEKTTRASRAMTKAIAAGNPAASLVELPKAGHMSLLTHPQSVNPALLDHSRGG